MGQRKREAAELQSLNRMVWGDAVYDRHVRESAIARAARRKRRAGAVPIVLGLQLLVAATVVLFLPQAAFAHTSAIEISCTQVNFNYQSFPNESITAHESITVDSDSPLTRDFTFTGPQATDTVALTLGSGTHTVSTIDSWTSSDGPGSAQAALTLSDCGPPPTTSTTQVATTTVAPTTTMGATSTIPVTTSTVTTPVTPLGSTSTTTSSPVGPLGSTSTTAGAPITTASAPTTTVPVTQLAMTGSSNKPLAAALAMLGLGLLAMGLGRRRRITMSN